jgi:hypothetical protein
MRYGTKLALAGLALFGAAICTGGCTSVRNGLGPRESVCLRALPVAREAVHAQGSYQGVKYFDARSFALLLAKRQSTQPAESPPPELAALMKSSVCLVEYRGTFTTADVEMGFSHFSGAGAYAVVVIKQSTNELVVTIVLPKPPLAFAKRVVG